METPDFYSQALDDELVALRIYPVHENTIGPEALSAALNALAGAGPLSFEWVGTHEQRLLIVRCARRFVPLVRGQLTMVYGSPEIIELDPADDPLRRLSADGRMVEKLHMVLGQAPALPLRTFRDRVDNAGMHELLAPFYGVNADEAVAIQIVVHGRAPENWARRPKIELMARQRNQELTLLDVAPFWSLFLGAIGIGFILVPFFLSNPWWRLCGWPAGLALVSLAATYLRGSGVRWKETSTDVVARKLEQTGFEAEIRLTAAAHSTTRVQQLMDGFAGAFQAFRRESGNSLKPNPTAAAFSPLDLARSTKQPMILGNDEIATLWHLPRGGIPDLLETSRGRWILPDRAAFGAEPGERTWLVGTAEKAAGPPIEIHLPLATISRRHVLVLGQTGTGKSNLLEQMIAALAQEPSRAIVVIDPHGDMVDRLLGLIPAARVDDVCLIDFADTQLLPVLNPLDLAWYGRDPERTVAAVMELSHTMFAEAWGPRMEVPYHYAMMALALANLQRKPETQFALLDAYTLLKLQAEARSAFLHEQLPPDELQTGQVIQYFQGEFDDLTRGFQQEIVSPVFSKLTSFKSKMQFLAAFGPSQSTINPVTAIANGRILLVKTGQAAVSEEFSDFAGSLMLNVVRRAVLAQESKLPAERTPVTLAADEAQTFSGANFGAALAAVRKFGGNFILTSQGASFLGHSQPGEKRPAPELFNQILANAGTRAVFRLSGRDANLIAQTEFANQVAPAELINLATHHAFLQFEAQGEMHGPFRVKVAPPLTEDPQVRERILAGRPAYSRRRADILGNREALLGRMLPYGGTLAERLGLSGNLVEDLDDRAGDNRLGGAPGAGLLGRDRPRRTDDE